MMQQMTNNFWRNKYWRIVIGFAFSLCLGVVAVTIFGTIPSLSISPCPQNLYDGFPLPATHQFKEVFALGYCYGQNQMVILPFGAEVDLIFWIAFFFVPLHFTKIRS
jgi:hypothetical protein